MASVIVYRAVLHVWTRRTMDVPVSWGYGGHLLVTLLRDSIQDYIWIIIALLVEIVPGALRISPSDAAKGFPCFPFIVVVPTSAATRMILHLQRVAAASRQSSVAIELVPIRTGIQQGTDAFILEEEHQKYKSGKMSM
ncbi:hypothetical protein NEOLEDRAFT_312622 [Neolentinus lepideus HHB14362 ss-1]|uniref:Uncharacterized protein n=1 Tax=Neolentinus lepideus HHB14362 ss-1 TaxID=1314782 RepID=A0A165VT62_9AGAM|nr:hypothetical protein NEOLEDRAFT_312622 [Neolentinus lepideus HHB14362 ss-1]